MVAEFYPQENILDEVWEVLRRPGNKDNDGVELTQKQIAAALLPLFETYVNYDQQGLHAERQKYLLLFKLRRLAESE